MKTVFLSCAGAGPREAGRADEWAQHLREAGLEVIDHGRYISYDLIMADLRRSDATVALVFDRRWDLGGDRADLQRLRHG
jgi:hypothetical protein